MSPVWLWLLALHLVCAPVAAHRGFPRCLLGFRVSRKTANPFTRRFNRFVQRQMELSHIPGMSVAIVKRRRVHTRGYGYSMLPNIKTTPDTIFYGGATTMAQTAACLSQLINSGASRIRTPWTTQISAITPGDFVVGYDWATRHVTLEDAASHRTGMASHSRAIQRVHRRGGAMTTRDIVRNMRNLQYPIEPRTEFIRSDHMYIALSHAMETMSHKSLAQLLRETIWTPLGMQSTFFGLPEVLAGAKSLSHQLGTARLAQGYSWNPIRKVYIPVAHMPARELSGAGAMLSSARDYALWIRALLKLQLLFPPAVHDDIRRPRSMSHVNTAAFGSGEFDITTYALGWYRSTWRGRPYYWHDGGMIGFRTLVFWFPDAAFGFAILTNSDGSMSALFAVAWKIVADYFCVRDRKMGIGHWLPDTMHPSAQMQRAIARFFPNHPQSRLTHPLSGFVGTYTSRGYGSIVIRAETQGLYANTLVIDRPEYTWHYSLRLWHVFSHFWIAAESRLDDPDNPYAFHPVESRYGGLSGPTQFKISWHDGLGRFEANTTFTYG